jgi:hypothetical protein
MSVQTRLLMTQYWEEAGYQEAAKVRSSFEEVCRMSPRWEFGHFHLAKYLDKVQSSKTDKDSKTKREIEP